MRENERTVIPGMYARISSMSRAVEGELGWGRRRALEAVYSHAIHRTLVEEIKDKRGIVKSEILIAYAKSLLTGWEYVLDESRACNPDIQEVMPVLQERGFIK